MQAFSTTQQCISVFFQQGLCVPAKMNTAGETVYISHDMQFIEKHSVLPRNHAQADIQAVGQNIPGSVSPRDNSQTRYFFPGKLETGRFCKPKSLYASLRVTAGLIKPC